MSCIVVSSALESPFDLSLAERIEYATHPFLDTDTEPLSTAMLEPMLHFIDSAARDPIGRVLVHCTSCV